MIGLSGGAMDGIDDPLIRRLVSIIVEAVSPEKVILFGSRAKGVARPDSDYDFLIIKPSIENEREISSAVYRALYRFPEHVSVDIVAIDAAKFERRRHDTGMIYEEADSRGIVVYG
jgi:predicted nucleotidyltransferase